MQDKGIGVGVEATSIVKKELRRRGWKPTSDFWWSDDEGESDLSEGSQDTDDDEEDDDDSTVYAEGTNYHMYLLGGDRIRPVFNLHNILVLLRSSSGYILPYVLIGSVFLHFIHHHVSTLSWVGGVDQLVYDYTPEIFHPDYYYTGPSLDEASPLQNTSLGDSISTVIGLSRTGTTSLYPFLAMAESAHFSVHQAQFAIKLSPYPKYLVSDYRILGIDFNMLYDAVSSVTSNIGRVSTIANFQFSNMVLRLQDVLTSERSSGSKWTICGPAVAGSLGRACLLGLIANLAPTPIHGSIIYTCPFAATQFFACPSPRSLDLVSHPSKVSSPGLISALIQLEDFLRSIEGTIFQITVETDMAIKHNSNLKASIEAAETKRTKAEKWVSVKEDSTLVMNQLNRSSQLWSLQIYAEEHLDLLRKYLSNAADILADSKKTTAQHIETLQEGEMVIDRNLTIQGKQQAIIHANSIIADVQPRLAELNSAVKETALAPDKWYQNKIKAKERCAGTGDWGVPCLLRWMELQSLIRDQSGKGGGK